MKQKLIAIGLALVAQPIFAFADGLEGNGNWGNHMGYMGSNWGNHMGFFGGGFMMVVWLIIIALAIGAIIKLFTTSRNRPALSNNAIVILKERFAKGEISKEEFETMKKQIS